MELRAKVTYTDGFGTLNVGDTTEGTAHTLADKQWMLDALPEFFELLDSVKVVEAFATPEDAMVIENPEAKVAKTTRKK